jgi:D-xylono/L-arabinono-1,4-lactonase
MSLSSVVPNLNSDIRHPEAAAMQEPEIVADFGDLNGEAPVWDPDTATLYWTDCVGFKFCRFQAGKSEVLRTGIEVTGFALNHGGGFVIANTKGIWFWDGAENLKLIAGQVDGAVCQMNDAAADPVGRFLAGSCFYEPTNDYKLGCLFRVDTDGSACVLDDGVHLANGIGFSPDAKELYLTDSAARIIYRYDYDVQTGKVRNRSVLVRVPLDEGVPDGLAVDSEGFLWSAQWYGSCVVRYDREGKVERRISTPAKQTSSVAFGGSNLSDLFITSAAQHFPSPLVPPNYDPAAGCIGGALYRLRIGIQGKPQFKTRLQFAE